MVNYQAQIVGTESVPTSYVRYRWKFLDAFADQIKDGQALRLVLPKGTTAKGAIQHWRKTVGYLATSKESKQSDGSVILWLWVKEKED